MLSRFLRWISTDFNDISTQPVPPSQAAKKEEGEEGPVIDRKCPKCNSEKMSYAAIQLRSADEGQTVFFTCVKCKYKESENSWEEKKDQILFIQSTFSENEEG